MATNARNPPQPPSNGVITAPAKGPTAGNRKKQKRRAKQAARTVSNEAPPPLAAAPPHPADIDHYDEDPLRYDDEEYDDEYSDAEPQHYHDQYIPPQTASNGYAMPPPAKNRRKNKKKRTSHHYTPDLLSSAIPPLPTPPAPSTHTSAAALRTMHKSVANHPNIWNTSTQQERQNIKDFWLSLSEDERKSLLKIEKEAVLRKMKQQQKHSCSCTVCGRKRTAIEEELEVLYEGYYEELENYAHHDPPTADGMLPEPLQHRRPPHPLAAPPPNHNHRSSQMLEHLDEEEEISEEEYSDEEDDEEDEEEDEEDEEDDYSDEEPEPPRGVPDFFNFGQNLTVKDNLLTVADDLLKNDGRKFIEMMEQLAERRMQRESEAEYAAANPSHPSAYPPNDPAYNHEDPLAAGDEYDDEEASYDSNEEYDDDLEDEDEMGGLTEEQRMQEGRRMFQIFAARMFEQRVLTAYKEKVAAERQQKLLEELQDEEKQNAQKEAKKKRDAEKKKEKKRLANLAKAEEKALKDAEKAAEDARLKEAEEKKQEEARRKREEQRKKKEEERRKQEEEKARKEAEKQRRQLEEQQRREEAERKAREQKAAEKAKKEETRKREREEREAREKEAKERKAQEEKDRKEREAKSKADREAKDRERQTRQNLQQHPPQIAKRPSQAGMVAVPGVHPKQTPSGISSPHTAIATPVIPKAPTPARQKQPSQHGSHASSPRQPPSQVSSVPSKSSSPGSAASQQQPPPNAGRPFMQKGPQQGPYQSPMMSSPRHHQQVQPPPGMQPPQQHQGAFGGMPPLGYQAFQGPQGPMMHNMGQRGPMPMYGHQGPHMGVPNRMSPFGPPGMNGPNGMNGPPGMMHPQGRGMGFPFDQPGVGAPPGFAPQMPPQQSTQTSPLGQPMSNGTPGPEVTRPSMPSHSRQQSSDKFNAGTGQPIARPAPIQRPGSIQSPPGEGSVSPRGDVEGLSKHLGSSALLDDSDEPMPQGENRRMSHNVLPASARSQSLGIGGLMQPPAGGFGTPSTSWNTPSLPFGQSPGLGQQQWGSLPNASPMTGWNANNNAFAANGAFGSMGVGAPMPMQMHRPSMFGNQSRPLAIRLAICQACKQMASTNPSSDGFHDINVLMRQMPALDPPPSLREIEEICETEGDSQNGGGELSARKGPSGGDVVAVKWAPDSGTPKDQARGSHAGLGEIGSPMPSRPSPAGIGFGGGRPGSFQSLGAVGGSSGF